MNDTENKSDIVQLLLSLHQKQDAQSEKMSEIHVSQARQEQKFDDHLIQDEKMYSKVEKISDRLDAELPEYKNQIAIHVKGVQTLTAIAEKQRSDHEALSERVEKVEEWPKFWGSAKKLMVEIGSAGAGIGALYAFFKFIFPHL